MSERSEILMKQVWDVNASTEEELVSSVLKLAVEHIQSYTAQNNMIVLDRDNLLQLAEELNN
jgi:hypothetical protein